jgi:hypothetical protein
MANEEKQIKVNLDPVLYAVSNVNIGFNEEVFDLLITSGNQGRQFRVSPKHAKRISMLLERSLDEYEKKFGQLKTQLLEKTKETQTKEGLGF